MFKKNSCPGSTTHGPLNEHHKQLISAFLVWPDRGVPARLGGPPGAPVVGTFGIGAGLCRESRVQLIDHPTADRDVVRRQDVTLVVRLAAQGEVPSEATFSRAFAEFATSALPSRLHEALIQDTHADRLVGHISRDSTAIEAREKPATSDKPAPQPKPAANEAVPARERSGPRRRPAGSNANGA